jgi:hypothetical protein
MQSAIIARLPEALRRHIESMQKAPLFAALFLFALWLCNRAHADDAEMPLWPPIFWAYSQVRYTHSETGADTWSIRRLKLMADGGRKDGPRYHLQFIYKTNNGSPTDDQPYLQDAYLLFPVGAVQFKMGQFIPAFGYERFQPDYKLDLVDRSDVTSRMVVNGNLGASFARDQGAQMDRICGPWKLALGLFQGGGANMAFRGNGPLGVAQITYGSSQPGGSPAGYWRMGFAVADRHAEDLDLSKAFPLGGGPLWQHFRGEDRRANGFFYGEIGPVRAQIEAFLVWLDPDDSRERAPQGAYAQVAWQPYASLITAARYEWFDPDAHDSLATDRDLWTVGATYDVPSLSLRIACDFSHPTTWWQGSAGDTIRLQFQWLLPSWRPSLSQK